MIWSSLKQLPMWVRLLVLGRFINAAGALAWLYLTVYLVQERGMDPAQAGFIVGANGAGLIAGNLCGGWLGDRFGIKRVMLIGHAGWAVTCASMPLAPNASLLLISILAGFCAGSGHPLGNALVADAVPPEQRRTGIAITRAAMNAGIMIGPPLGALAAGVDFRLVFIIDAVTSLALMLIVWRFVPSAGPRSKDDIPTGFFRAVRADRRVRVLVVGVVALDTAYRQIFTGLPLMLTDDRTPLIGYAALISISCLIIVLAETPLAIYLAKHPALRVISSGWALVGLGFVVLAVWPQFGGAALAILIITVGEMLYKPTSPAFAADRAPSGMSGRYQSLYSGASISGMVISPPLGGFVYQYAPALLWPLCAVLALVAAAVLASLD